jgi:hypothetical protein
MDTTGLPRAAELHPYHRETAAIVSANAEIAALRQGLTDLQTHLVSEKFRTDTTIQVADVMRWINAISASGHEAANEGWNVGVTAALARHREIADQRQAKLDEAQEAKWRAAS